MNKLFLSLIIGIFLIGLSSGAICGVTSIQSLYNSTITGGINTTMVANITLFGSFGGLCLIENVALNYNNTQYLASFSHSTGNVTTSNLYYNISLITPLVSTTTNITLNTTTLFSYSVLGDRVYTYYTSSNTNQTLNTLLLDDCSSGTFKIMNFTIYDEDSLVRLRTPIYNQTYSAEVYINDVFVYSGNKTNLNEFKLCSNVAIGGNLSLDLTLQYDADGTGTGYVNEYYNLQNYDLNQYTANRNISLYDLIATNSEECLFTIKDDNFLPLNDALVQITRKYLSDGTFKDVEIPKTDSLGKTIGHFVLNDEIYSVYLRQNGNLLASYTNVRAVKPTGSDCIFNLNIPSASSTPEDFTAYGDLLYYVNYTDSTRTYTATWITNSGANSNITLYAYIDGVSICSSEILASSATSQCVFSSSYQNKTARLVLSNNGNVVFEDYINIGYKRPNLNPVRYIIVASLIPMMVLMGGSSIAIATVFFILGLILSGGFMFFDTETFIGAGSFIMWLVIGALILLFKFSRGRQNG